MDEPSLPAAEHHAALEGLARINRISRSARILWPSIRRLAVKNSGRPLRVLDVASGAGDVAVALAKRAERAGLLLHIVGVDISPIAVEHARRRATAAGASADFQVYDALATPLCQRFDVVMSSLFLHHLDRPTAVTLLDHMGRTAERAVLVSDLRRSRAGYLAAQAVCRLATRSPIVHVDGPRSVAAAFTIDEAQALASEAGLAGATIKRRWPFRFLLTWHRSA